MSKGTLVIMVRLRQQLTRCPQVEPGPGRHPVVVPGHRPPLLRRTLQLATQPGEEQGGSRLGRRVPQTPVPAQAAVARARVHEHDRPGAVPAAVHAGAASHSAHGGAAQGGGHRRHGPPVEDSAPSQHHG